MSMMKDRLVAEALAARIQQLRDDGYTFRWEPTGETRERWWFFGKRRIQQLEVKIDRMEYVYYTVYRWKTIKYV